MSDRSFMLFILKNIEKLDKSIFTYAHQTNVWWEVSVSDYEFYISDKFRKFKTVWHILAQKKGLKILFVCGWVPTEETLLKLADEDNLILNI